ncbi:MAG: hypothetical protein LBT05_14970 [Planctomycetaceae bacterium]|nr:hypothetical protein [Planctomycetaceae bacterium]
MGKRNASQELPEIRADILTGLMRKQGQFPLQSTRDLPLEVNDQLLAAWAS